MVHGNSKRLHYASETVIIQLRGPH